MEDIEGNTALHVKCYGDMGQPSENDAIDALINAGANMSLRNKKVRVSVTSPYCTQYARVIASYYFVQFFE